MVFAKHNPRLPEGVNASRENPLKEFVLMLVGILLATTVIIGLLVVLAQFLLPYIPFRYEHKLVEQLALVEEEIGEESASDALLTAQTRLRTLGQQLAAEAALPDDMALQFHLLDAPDTPNAFATLGGHIFVTTGLLAELSTENALALVLAHEIAHIKYRHPIQALGSGAMVQLLLGLIGVQSSIALQSTVGQAGVLTLLGFNRKMERAADHAAVATLLRHYGHLSGADEFFVKMAQRRHVAKWQRLFETHPDSGQRAETLQALIDSQSEPGAARPLDEALGHWQ